MHAAGSVAVLLNLDTNRFKVEISAGEGVRTLLLEIAQVVYSREDKPQFTALSAQSSGCLDASRPSYLSFG
jgi:hypothetical protein